MIAVPCAPWEFETTYTDDILLVGCVSIVQETSFCGCLQLHTVTRSLYKNRRISNRVCMVWVVKDIKF
jgi:hypothetical protein